MNIGQLLGQRRFLLLQLRRKYGVVPGEIAAKVEAAGEADLEVWSLALLDAPDLEAIFSNPTSL